MSTTNSSTDTEEQGLSAVLPDIAVEVLDTIRRSFLATTGVIGLVVVGLGAAIGNGVPAGLLGIMGTMLVAVAVVGMASIKVLRYL